MAQLCQTTILSLVAGTVKLKTLLSIDNDYHFFIANPVIFIANPIIVNSPAIT